MDHIVLEGGVIGFNDVVGQGAEAGGAAILGEVGENGLLEERERIHGLGEETIRACGEGDGFGLIIAGGAEDHVDPGRDAVQRLDEGGTGTIGQADIHDDDGRAVDLQMTFCGADGIGATDAGTGAQAEEPHGIGGIAAVFDDENREAEERAARGRLAEGGEGIELWHGSTFEGERQDSLCQMLGEWAVNGSDAVACGITNAGLPLSDGRGIPITPLT